MSTDSDYLVALILISSVGERIDGIGFFLY